MSTQTYEYRFDTSIPIQELEDTLMLSLIAVESIFGHSRVRMDGRFDFDKKNRRCRIDCSNEVGTHLARIFTGYATREYGENAVHIEGSEFAAFRTPVRKPQVAEVAQ
jgi:hypothetical protein